MLNIFNTDDETKRKLIAEKLLEFIGCDMKELQLLGQGAYSTVYKGLHPNQVDNPGVVIALKVVSGPEEDIKNEKITSIEMKNLQPMDWEKQKKQFDSFAKSLCGKGAQVNPNIVKRAKYYKKYLNVSTLYREFDYTQVRDILGKKYEGGDLEFLWPSFGKKQIAYIFTSPLAEGDMWRAFQNASESLNDFKERMRKIRKAAKGVLKALIVLHAKGRLHLDIKPDNILQVTNVKGKTVAQLADFGLLDVETTPDNDVLKEVGKVDKCGFVKVKRVPSPIGSPSSSNSAEVRWKVTGWYKAPEQTGQKMLDIKQLTKIDIYSLGATLLIMYLAAKNGSEKAMNIAAENNGVQSLIRNLPNYLSDVDKNVMTSLSPEIRVAEKRLLKLIEDMMSSDPKNRPTAQQALNYSFLKTKI